MGLRAETCSICGSDELHELPEFTELPRVTSDSRPVPPGGRLAVCPRCGAVQKFPDAKWRSEIAAIYSAFVLDRQSGGEEQLIFDESGIGLPRSERIIDFLAKSSGVESPAKVLDFGCGRGATLKVLAKRWPKSELFGAELSAATEPELLRIPGFKKLYTCPPEEIDNRFDLILLIHSLATFATPMDMLRGLRKMIVTDGRLVIQLPDIAKNPYNILIADCLLHFTPDVLQVATALAGFNTELMAAGSLVNEISYVGQPNSGAPRASLPLETESAMRRAVDNIAWLKSQVDDARRLSGSSHSFGIFGSSISGSWLAGAVGDRVDFFVDEDRRRTGTLHMGRPIISVDSIPADSTVFVPLAPNVARPVIARLRSLGVNCEAA